MEIVPYQRPHLEAILALADGVAFESLVADPDRAHRAMTAPGAVALVALEDGEPIGFAHTITDGAIQAYLGMLLVAPAAQRGGVGRALAEESLARSGAVRMDLISTEEAEPFYRSLPHRGPWPGYRLDRPE
jgi:GNAT superfamily N-acetyltransferase